MSAVSLPSHLLVSLAVSVTLMVLAWVAGVLLRDASIVDRLWGLGFVLIGWVTFAITDSDTVRKTLTVVLATLWGLRLSIYISWRNWGRGEDYRYRDMREKHGSRFPLVSLFTVFLLQALILWAVAAPLIQAQRADRPDALTGIDILGVLAFGIGFGFEVVGDWQLARFRRDPSNRGKVLDTGLWRYTRHPNYFGDALVWWGLFAFALATPGGWWTLYSPVLMTLLLMKVSGVSLLEKRLKETKPRYRSYAERTNAFFPWFPKAR